MTAVCNCEPTPSWLPRITSNVAVITLAKEGDDEHAIGEPTLEIRTRGSQQRIQRGNDHDQQIRLYGHGNIKTVNTPTTTPMINPIQLPSVRPSSRS